MTKRLLLILCFLMPMLTQAQELAIDWSPYVNYDRMSTGNMTKFAGANDKYVYSLFSPTYKKLDKNERTLVVYDKNTMRQVGKLHIQSSVDFKNVRITKNVVYVLSIDNQKGKEILYAQSYTPTLEVISAKRKIYQVATSNSIASRHVTSAQTIVNKDANDNLYIVAEKPAAKNENVQIEYCTIDSKLNQVNSGQITLPVISLRNTSYNLSNFSISDDGNILCKNTIKADRETRKEEKIFSYAILSVIDPSKQTIKSLPIKASGKHINDFEYFSNSGKLYVAGFYKESEGKYSERGNGVFVSVLNVTSGELENTKFTEIKAPKVNFGLLYLERIKQNKDGNITLYATEDENIVITTQTKNGTTTTYKNIKGDILAVNLNRDGSLNWQNTINRSITYDQLYIRDVQVMCNNENSYITYADRYKSGRRNFFNRKSSKEMRDILTYYKINTASGTASAQTLKLNKSNTEKSKMKYVNATALSEIDNVLYLDGFQLRPKTGFKAITCFTAPLCGFGCGYFYIKMKNGSALTGGGSLGSIKIDK